MMENEKTSKKPMSHEERVALAAKLDRELDEFIEKLPKKKYDEGWPEDRWEEEMEKHPFFMTQTPKPGQELHPLYEGLQQLKYDPEENEPEELAINYKEDGNFNFKHKNYRLAIVAYTEGIKINCGNPDIQCNLLNNRAAAHYFLQNYRSSLMDCECALKISPSYEKALKRAAKCCYHMKRYEEAAEYCDRISENDKEIVELKNKSLQAAFLKKKDHDKKESAARKKARAEKALIIEILKRGYTIEGGAKGNLSLEKLEPCFPELVKHRVHLNESSLVWPVVFVYPEYQTMDYIQSFCETDRFVEHLAAMFAECPEWDDDKKYKVDDISIYYETPKQRIVKVNKNKTLGEALKMEGYVIKGGTPCFIVSVKDSPAEQRFLKRY